MKTMKSKFLAMGIAALTLILGLALAACDSLLTDKESHVVTFYAEIEDGNPSIQTQTVPNGGSVGASNMPSDPSKSGYAFDGWYTDKGERFSGTTKVTADTTVYAKWTADPKTDDASTEAGAYELKKNPDYDNYIYNNSNDFLPSGFTVNAGDRITVSLSIKTDTAMKGFYIGIGDWNNINRYDDPDDAWIAPGWEESKSVPADGQFHSYTWTLTAKSAAPAGSNPLVFHFAMESVSKPTVTVHVKDVNIVKSSNAPSNLSLAESLAWIANNAAEGGAYTVTLTKNEIIAPQTLSYSGKTVHVILDGGTSERTVSLSAAGSLFTVESGVTLMLSDNVTLQGRSDNTASLVYVSHYGNLVMNAGSKISGNNNTSGAGGGVYIAGAGTFAMNGGAVSGNSTSSNAGGVFIDGSGRFAMDGGEISGNSASNIAGGVYAAGNSTFVMSGGEISDNSASRAGGVSVNGVFAMIGGEISGNSASGSQGGGVYVTGSGTFTKQSGGTIYGSNASDTQKNTASSDRYGHAVYVSGSPGKIRNDTADSGVDLDSAKDGAAGGWVDGAVAQYAVITYNANGASGTPPSAESVPTGSTVTVAGQESLTYSGKTFNGWNTGPDGTGTPYSAGASLTVNADITLYAQWTDITYTITYNANGASGTPPSTESVPTGSTVTVAGQGSLTYSGKTFNGWNTGPAGTGTPYSAGASLTVNADITLYAQWRSNPALTWEHVSDLPDDLPMDWYDTTGYGYHHASVMNGTIVVTYLDGALVSSDGVHWSSTVVLPAASDGYYDIERNQHILFNNKLYSVGGYHYTISDNYFMVDSLVTESSDLNSWAVKTGVTGLTDGIINHVGLAFNNAMWVISGTTEYLFDDWLVTDAIWKSTDGINWIKQDAAGLAPRGEAAGVVYNGKIYITGGYMDGGQDELNDVVVSSDGTTWTTLTTNPGWLDRNGHTLTANSQGMWLIGGNGGDNAEFFNDVWFSSDGVTWTNKGNAPFAPRAGHASVIKDGYLYVIGGITGDWETYLSDVWCAYIGGTDMDASSYSIEPATLTITNSNSCPLKSLYINGGSNELSSNLAIGASWKKQFEPGTYSFTIHDTQDKYQSFVVTIGTASQTWVIGTSGWTAPVVVIPEYTLTVMNSYDRAISEVYVRKSGTSAWGSDKTGAGSIATNVSVSLGSFESGQYDIKLVSKKSTGTKILGGAGTKKPATGSSKKVETFATIYFYKTVDLTTANNKVTAPSLAGSWTTEAK